jgi:hypothetical protein
MFIALIARAQPAARCSPVKTRAWLISIAAAGNADALLAVERNSGEALTFSWLAHLAFIPKIFFRCMVIDMRARRPSFTSAAFMQSITAMLKINATRPRDSIGRQLDGRSCG